MTAADWFILGFTSATVLGAALAWRQLEKIETANRKQWDRKPPLTEQEIIDRAARRRT
jgi:hypothetical protein